MELRSNTLIFDKLRGWFPFWFFLTLYSHWKLQIFVNLKKSGNFMWKLDRKNVSSIYSFVSIFFSQYANKDSQLKTQLQAIGTMLPTVQMHLILCTSFANTANKHEFLLLVYQLIDRLTALAHMAHPIRWVKYHFIFLVPILRIYAEWIH